MRCRWLGDGSVQLATDHAAYDILAVIGCVELTPQQIYELEFEKAISDAQGWDVAPF